MGDKQQTVISDQLAQSLGDKLFHGLTATHMNRSEFDSEVRSAIEQFFAGGGTFAGDFTPEQVQRAEEEPPSWDTAPEWANWRAKDFVGAWTWYENQPAAAGFCYTPNPGDRWLFAKAGTYNDHDWRETLQCRPVKCPHTKTEWGYGYAAGPLGAYRMCVDCSAVVEFKPDDASACGCLPVMAKCGNEKCRGFAGDNDAQPVMVVCNADDAEQINNSLTPAVEQYFVTKSVDLPGPTFEMPDRNDNFELRRQPAVTPDRSLTIRNTLRAASAMLRRWADKYGENDSDWLAPSGHVNTLELIDEALGILAAPQPQQAVSVPNELIGAVREIANSHTDNEITDRPLWWIIDPRQMLRTDAHAVYSMFKGPFFSREAATEFMNNHKYRYGKNVLVYCGSCNDAPQFKRLYDISRRLAAAPEAPKS